MIFRPDCKHFLGDRPCRPHKASGVHCEGCPSFEQRGKSILIIKLEAMGDVLRTTPLIPRLRNEYPGCRLTWLTRFPEILPAGSIDEILPYDSAAVLQLQQERFDLAINLDKEKAAGAVLAAVSAEHKAGFVLRGGVIQPYDERAQAKYLCGIFDDLAKANTKSYAEEIFEICGFDYRGEPCLIERRSPPAQAWRLPASGVVGLNTGAGERWPTRLWSEKHWRATAWRLREGGLHPILLGGPAEHERNLRLATESGAAYFGVLPIPQFISLMDRCDVVITQVTMALHVAVALEKKVVLMNNIFNPREFDLRGRGAIIEPRAGCECFYASACRRATCCMEEIESEEVAAAAVRLAGSGAAA